MDQTGSLLYGKGGTIKLTYLFWPVVSNMRRRLNQVSLNFKILSRNQLKSTLKITSSFLSTHALVQLGAIFIIPTQIFFCVLISLFPDAHSIIVIFCH